MNMKKQNEDKKDGTKLVDLKPNPKGRLHEIFCNAKHGFRGINKICAWEEQIYEAMRMIDYLLADQKQRILQSEVMKMEELPTSAELEKIYLANEGNISRSEILEAEDNHIVGRNELREEIRKAIKDL